MDAQEMMERLLATINASQAKSDAGRKVDREERKADKEEMLAAMKANEEMTARMDAKMWSMQDELK
jgi:hypothetical protein